MDKFLSQRVQRVQPSPTLAVTAQAIALRKAGKDIISLSSGEPDFDTPQFIKEAAIAAITSGKTKYTPVDGIVELKQAIVDKFKRDNQQDYQLDEVMVGTGGKQLIYNLFQSVLNAGDEVIIPTPYWVSYPDMALLADATPVFVETDIRQAFKVTAEQLEAAITPRTKIVMLNSPSNPTGAVYTREELQALAAVLENHDHVLLASDDIYEKILLADQPYVNVLEVAPPALKARTVLLNGVSKAYAMTGWRLGYAAGPADIIKAMKKVQSQSTSNPTSITQYAALAALQGDESFMIEMNQAFAERNQFVVAALNKIEGVRCLPSQGAFYAFADFQTVVDRLEGVADDVALAAYILEQAEVAAVPGSAFGNVGYLRFSCATSMENLQAALARIQQLLST